MNELELKKKVDEWLNSQGYPLEMKIAQAFAKKEFDVLQPYHFPDPETNTLRETDLVVRCTDHVGLLQLFFVIECKKSDKPWVMISSENNSYNRLHSFAFMSDKSLDAVAENLDSMLELPWYKRSNRIGYGITQAFTSGNDICFKAMMSATKGAVSYFSHDIKKEVTNGFSFVFPIIILDGHLFESHLDQNGKTQTEALNSGHILFNIPLGKVSGKTVRIITLERVESLVEEIDCMFSFFSKTLAVQLKKADEKLFEIMQRHQRRQI